MVRPLIDWFNRAAAQAKEDGFADRALSLGDTAAALDELAEFDLKEVLAFLESCQSEPLGEFPETDQPSRLFESALAAFDPFIGASPKKLLQRFQNVLAYAGQSGGLGKFIVENSHRAEKSLIGLWREIQAHETGNAISGELKASLKRATVAQLRQVSKKLDLAGKGGKSALLTEIESNLSGSSPAEAKPKPSTEKAQQLLSRLREDAAAGATSAKLETIFNELSALDPEIIAALGAENFYAEKNPRKLLKLIRASIHEIQAQANRS
ncbi:MAG: hypothetical protein ACI8UO_003072 [Verrucomicrobiales bacterium]|jgi:hypothetical protein